MAIPPYVIECARRYEATGRVASLHPRQERISLNGGRSLTWQDAYNKMLDTLKMVQKKTT